MEFNDFSSLTALFQSGLAKERESCVHDQDASKGGASVQKLTPGSIGSPKKMRTETNESSKDIWAEDEVPNDATVDPFDTRPQPEYSITYRQKVSSEDMYLQMGGKTPGFRDSDEIIVTVELPGCEFKEIELTCTKTLVDVRCPKFKLIVNLPREVRDQDGNASWNKSKQQLVVNIPIKPDF